MMFEKSGMDKGGSSTCENPLKELTKLIPNSSAKDNTGVEANNSSRGGDLTNVPSESRQKAPDTEALENPNGRVESPPSKRAKMDE